MTKSIKHQFFFSQPPDLVWEYLINPDLMVLWLMKNNFQPIIGFDFQFRTNPIPSMEFDGIFYCKVLEIIPLKKLSYSWKSGPEEGKITLDSVVVWRLEPNDKGTELFLDHSGFTDNVPINFYNGLTEGWLKNIHKIADRLNAAQHATANS